MGPFRRIIVFKKLSTAISYVILVGLVRIIDKSKRMSLHISDLIVTAKGQYLCREEYRMGNNK